jgi:hypothetical protein
MSDEKYTEQQPEPKYDDRKLDAKGNQLFVGAKVVVVNDDSGDTGEVVKFTDADGDWDDGPIYIPPKVWVRWEQWEDLEDFSFELSTSYGPDVAEDIIVVG